MSKLSTVMSRGRFLGAAVALSATTLVAGLAPITVSADQVTNRSLTISSSAPGGVSTGDPGSSTNGQQATYTFEFYAAQAATIKSFSVLFCNTAFGYMSGSNHLAPEDGCTTGAPTGMDASTFTNPVMQTYSGSAWSNAGTWTKSVPDSKASSIGVTNTTGVALTEGQGVRFIFETIKNPTVTNYTNGGDGSLNTFENTFFAHMDLYSDDDFSTIVDEGTTTSAITTGVALEAKVQETLKFSVGTQTAAAGTYCDPLSGTNTLTLGDAVNGALDVAQAYYTHSYFRVSTNSANGTSIQYVGSTLTSGPYTIDPMTAGGQSTVASEQFGLTIDDDDAANSLTSLTPTGNYNGDGTATSTFQFVDTDADTAPPQEIAASGGGITCDTGAIRYVGNININTESGIYTTKINYIAVPEY